MDDDFELPVLYEGKELLLPARLIQFGYTYRIEVDIESLKVSFEKDDEQQWRALLSYEDIQANKRVPVALLEAVAQGIEKVLR